MIMGQWWDDGWQGEIEYRLLLCPLQISNGLPGKWTHVFAVGGWRLNTRTMTWPGWSYISANDYFVNSVSHSQLRKLD